MQTNGKALIGSDLVVVGDVRNAGEVEVRGAVHGTLSGGRVVVYPGGSIVGALDADSAEVNGVLQGRVRVRNLISIGAEGSVRGDVRYGQLALSPGGDLAADVRNVPPSLGGDFEVVVRRGRRVRLTQSDLLASDPDDGAGQLVYQASNLSGGYLIRSDNPALMVDRFTQHDIDEGLMFFVHDGGTGEDGGFDVSVSDSAGNSAGAARRVQVTVIPG